MAFIVCYKMSMEDDHDFNLKADVLLLADVFEEFRNMCLGYYVLGLCLYINSPGLILDAMLNPIQDGERSPHQFFSL